MYFKLNSVLFPTLSLIMFQCDQTRSASFYSALITKVSNLGANSFYFISFCLFFFHVTPNYSRCFLFSMELYDKITFFSNHWFRNFQHKILLVIYDSDKIKFIIIISIKLMYTKCNIFNVIYFITLQSLVFTKE